MKFFPKKKEDRTFNLILYISFFIYLNKYISVDLNLEHYIIIFATSDQTDMRYINNQNYKFTSLKYF